MNVVINVDKYLVLHYYYDILIIILYIYTLHYVFISVLFGLGWASVFFFFFNWLDVKTRKFCIFLTINEVEMLSNQ